MDNMTKFKNKIIERNKKNQANSFSKFLKDERKELINYSIKKESKIAKFKSRLEVVNTKNNTMVKMEHNPLKVAKNDYLWFSYNQMLLQDKMAESGEYVALFITLTLPSSYHRYSSHSKRYNPSYNKEHTINRGYKLLSDSFREIYKNFRVNRKFEKIYYSRVVEPHKDFTAHLHAIIYVKKEFLDNLINHIKKIISKNGLGRYEIEEIKNIKRSTSYLLKYIKKNTNPPSEKDFHFFNGWKKKHKIRVFTHSNLVLEKFIFQKINNVLKLSKGLKDKNPIIEVLEKCDISINTKCKTTKEFVEKKYKNSSARYKVEINRTREIQEVKEEIFVEKTKAINYFEAQYLLKTKKIKHSDILEPEGLSVIIRDEVKYEFFEKVYTYKIESFKITDTETDKVLYDKSDFMMKDDFLDMKYEKGEFDIVFN